MSGEHRVVFGGIAIALALWPLAAASAEPCRTIELGGGRVAAIENSRTVALSDGRKIRLAGIEWAVPEAEAKAALSELLLGRLVSLAAPEKPDPDRYGRLHAFPILHAFRSSCTRPFKPNQLFKTIVIAQTLFVIHENVSGIDDTGAITGLGNNHVADIGRNVELASIVEILMIGAADA